MSRSIRFGLAFGIWAIWNDYRNSVSDGSSDGSTHHLNVNLILWRAVFILDKQIELINYMFMVWRARSRVAQNYFHNSERLDKMYEYLTGHGNLQSPLLPITTLT